MSSHLVVSLHDVAPATAEASRRWLRLVERHGMRATLLVVPGPWRGASLAADPEFAGWLRSAHERGHEISLHGWEHRARDWSRSVRGAYGRVLSRGCAEFWQLDEPAARRRIVDGLDVLRAHGLGARGFTPPAWLASDAARRAARDLGLAYTTTQWSVIDLRDGERIRAFAVSQRPGSAVTPLAARIARTLTGRRLRRGGLLRLALHPDDLAHARLRTDVEDVLRSAAARGYTSTTYLDLVERADER